MDCYGNVSPPNVQAQQAYVARQPPLIGQNYEWFCVHLDAQQSANNMANTGTLVSMTTTKKQHALLWYFLLYGSIYSQIYTDPEL